MGGCVSCIAPENPYIARNGWVSAKPGDCRGFEGIFSRQSPNSRLCGHPGRYPYLPQRSRWTGVEHHPRQGRDRRLRAGGLHGGNLCRPRHARSDPDPGHGAWRPAHRHHRRRELSRLCRRDPGPLAHGADAEAGGPCRHQARRRLREQGRSSAPAVSARLRFRRRLFRRGADFGDRRAGPLARSALRAEIPRLWNLRLRHLRRLLLSRQAGAGDRRRQYRGRGGAVSHQFRRQGHAGASARQPARRENPAGPAVQASQDRRDLGQRA